MSKVIMPGGAGGADLDVVTAGAGDVLAPKVIVGPDGEPLTGTIPDNGSAAIISSASDIGNSNETPNHVYVRFKKGYYSPHSSNDGSYLWIPNSSFGTATKNRLMSGYTMTSTDGCRVTGTLAIQSAINFNVAVLSYNSVRFQWLNPSTGPWEGVFIQMSTGGYPGQTGGTRIYTGAGNNPHEPGGYNWIDIGGLAQGTTYYFTATSYVNNVGWGPAVNCAATTVARPAQHYIIDGNGYFTNGHSAAEWALSGNTDGLGIVECGSNGNYLRFKEPNAIGQNTIARGYYTYTIPSNILALEYTNVYMDRIPSASDTRVSITINKTAINGKQVVSSIAVQTYMRFYYSKAEDNYGWVHESQDVIIKNMYLY